MTTASPVDTPERLLGFTMTASFLVFAVPLVIGGLATLLISSPDVP